MRRILPLAAALAVAISLAVSTSASATSGAHFFKGTGASVNDSGALVVTIDEAGVGQQVVDYTLTANATAIWACINGGGNHPKAANKETVQGQVSTGGSFQAKNGRVRASLTAGPLSAGSFSCPGGQHLELAKVTYSNIVLTDTTNNVTTTVPNVCRSFLPSMFPC